MPPVIDISREDLVIKKFFEDTPLQHKIAPHLEQDIFEDLDNQKICDWIIRFQDVYNRYPGAQELIAAIPPCSQRNKLIKLCNTEIQPMERKFEIDMIEKFFRERKTVNILASASESIYENNFDNITDLIIDLQNSVNFNLNTDNGLDIVDDTDEALRRLNESMRAIPSALSDLRAFTSGGNGFGGHYRKALTIFMGMPNVGKSIVLCNEASFAYQKGYNVLYVTMEMAEELIWERVAANITDINLKDLRSGSVEEIKQRLQTVPDDKTASTGHFTVKSLPTTATVIDIENAIIELKRTKGIDVDMLVVDYIGIMKPSKRANSINQHSLYTMGKEIAEQLRDLAKSREIAVVTASQLNRDGYSSKDASMSNVAGSAGLNDTADLMVTITQDETLKGHHLFYHMILKNRFGPNTIGFMTKCDYTHMRVRSASDEDIKKYSESQTSQENEISDFSSRDNELRGSDIAPSKSAEEIEADKKAMRDAASNYIKGQISSDKENILDSTSIDDSVDVSEISGESDKTPEALF